MAAPCFFFGWLVVVVVQPPSHAR